MIEQQSDEKIISGYDPRVMRRILKYARPYRKLLLVALGGLILATVGEMLVPVMIQRTVDHQILDYWVRVRPAQSDRFQLADQRRRIGDWVYLREEALDRISRAERDELREGNAIDTRRVLLISTDILRRHEDVAERVEGAIRARSSRTVVLPVQALEALSSSDRLTLRQDNVAGVRRNVLLFLGILVLVLLATFAQVYLTAYTGQLVMKDLRMRVFGHTIHQHLGFLGNEPVGKLVTRATNDIQTINELFTSVLAELTRNISLMIAVVVTMYSLNARLATIVILSMVAIVPITDFFRRRARTAFRRVRSAVSTVNAYLSEYISGMNVVQLFVQQARSRREFRERNRELLAAHLSEMHVFAVFRPIVDFMATISTTVVIFFGAQLLQVELVSLGVLIAFTNLIRRFYMPVMSLSEQFTVLQSAMAGAERVFDLLDTDRRIADTGRIELDSGDVRGEVRFDHVQFSYKENEPVLRNVSFDAPAGRMLAVVGYTGAGKTTIINLLTRLWDVDAGRITLDGTDIRDISLASLRSAVQQIQQDVYLFNDTIRNNITLGKDVSDEIVLDACRKVQLADYIDGLPDGLNTVLHERGANVSAGRQQLVSFARVLVHDPPVLVLDEATSNIDSETEQRLQHAVRAVTGGRTSIVIAHRLSTIQNADQIIVLSRGAVVESGTHQELIDNDDLYATLYRLQYERRDSSRS